jgi:SAM-dependent methyltransferase
MRDLACLCGNRDDVSVLYEQNFSEAMLSPSVFTARGKHDYAKDHWHYRIVRCKHCGQLFSSPILDPDRIASLYRESPQAYTEEGGNIVRSYLRPLRRWLDQLPARGSAVEIGCGHGAVLGALRELGFAQVTGVEPSEDAVRRADPGIRSLIRMEMFEAARFPPSSADLVCAFQVLDHFTDPLMVLRDVRSILKPGGLCYVIIHNEQALQVRVFGEQSPIIDVSHIYYFNPATLRRTFEQTGFEVLDQMNIWNAYSLRTWFRMLPVPGKEPVLRFLERRALGALTISIPAGNIGLIARKRADI